MAAGIQTNNGKAFEYACVMSLYNRLCKDQEVSIEDTPQFRTAKNFFNSMSEKMKLDLTAAANAATRVIIRLEPQLEYPSTNITLYLIPAFIHNLLNSLIFFFRNDLKRAVPD